MANSDAPFGFRPINRDGSPYNGATTRGYFLAADTTAAFIGDAVISVGTSLAGAMAVEAADAGDDVYGVIVGFDVNPDDLGAQYRKASTLRYCKIATADSTFFEAQDSGTLGLAAAGSNVPLIESQTGSTVYGLSGMEIGTGNGTTTTLDLQLVAPVDRDDNDGTAANANWIVKFNKSQTRPARQGV